MSSTHATRWAVAGVLFVLATNSPDVLGQTAAPVPDSEAFLDARSEKLEQIQSDKDKRAMPRPSSRGGVVRAGIGSFRQELFGRSARRPREPAAGEPAGGRRGDELPGHDERAGHRSSGIEERRPRAQRPGDFYNDLVLHPGVDALPHRGHPPRRGGE